MYERTDEQKTIIKYVTNTDGILLIDAVAGSGKTATGIDIVNSIKPTKALGTAFNKSIVVENASIYPDNIQWKTMHALALAAVRPKLPIEDFTYTCIKEDVSYYDKRIIIQAIDEFYRSASLDSSEFITKYIQTKLQTNTELTETEKNKKIFLLTGLANNYIEAMINDKVNPTFNYLLKWFHTLLANGNIKANYDLAIFDEVQDSTAVALEIFKLIEAPKKVLLGDQEQAIYHFMNLVNGFEVLKDEKLLHLTRTFRCSTAIASEIEVFCQQYLDKSFSFKGNDYPVRDGKTAYISSTNAAIIETINEMHREGKGYILTRNIKEIFAAPLAVLTASTGKTVYHKKYRFLENEYKRWKKSKYSSFLKYLSNEVDDEEIRMTVKLLAKFNTKRINIWDVLNEAKVAKRDPRITIGTAFSLKGMGYETVHLHQDINNAVAQIIDSGGPTTSEEIVTMRLYYVACTRARCNLYNAQHLSKLNFEYKG